MRKNLEYSIPRWTCLLTLTACFASFAFSTFTAHAQTTSPRLIGASLSASDWMVLTEGDRQGRYDYGTFGLGLYFTGWGWNASLALPYRTSFMKSIHETRTDWGDGEITLGRPFVFAGANGTARGVLRVPFYDWSVDDASTNILYIGPGTVRGGLGLGLKAPTTWLPRPFTAGIDAEATTALTRGLADFGTTHMWGSVYVTRAIGSRAKITLNTLALFDHLRWVPDYWDQKQETKFSVLPGLAVGMRLFKATSVDLKAGVSVYDFIHAVEPRYAIKPTTSYYFGASVYQGF